MIIPKSHEQMTEGIEEWGKLIFYGVEGKGSIRQMVGHQEQIHGDKALKKSVEGEEKPLRTDHAHGICGMRKNHWAPVVGIISSRV